jgi:gamma-aminobutyric acid type B receptor
LLLTFPQIIELKRNPQGVIDKRVRATLRPMSKAERRDSSACELEQKLRDVKSNNCRFRKALMDREAELQALIRKLGQEASNWLEGGSSETEPILKDQGRLSVGPVRKDLPSQTGKHEETSKSSSNSTYFNESFISYRSHLYRQLCFKSRGFGLRSQHTRCQVSLHPNCKRLSN